VDDRLAPTVRLALLGLVDNLMDKLLDKASLAHELDPQGLPTGSPAFNTHTAPATPDPTRPVGLVVASR
jgi:hypothetical protein